MKRILRHSDSLSETVSRSPKNQKRAFFLLVILILLSLQFFERLPTFDSISSNGNEWKNITEKDDTNTTKGTVTISQTKSTIHAHQVQSMINNYTWEGNTSRWVPPMGATYLTPRELRRIFLSENTLWIGDSTARQDYQTMYTLIDTDDEHENTKHLDFPNAVLQKNVNRGKGGAKIRYHCPARQVPRNVTGVVDLGQVKGSDQNCSANITTPKKNQTTLSNFALDNTTGKFDFFSQACYSEPTNFVKKYPEEIKREYSVMVISIGMWEVFRPWDCGRGSSDVWNLLDDLRDFSGPSLFVVWKTFGPSAKPDGKNNLYNALNNRTRDWFAENKPSYMDLVDFDRAIQERAWGKSRISGDLAPHWGPEARVLSIEMISDVVRRKQDRSKSSV